MKFSQLLNQRDALLRQARLANIAFAYAWLQAFAGRAARARLHGGFTLRAGDSVEGPPWPTLDSETTSPAVLAEHFLEEDIVELADILAYLHDGSRPPERPMRWADFEQSILPALRRELEMAGIPTQEPASPEPNATAGLTDEEG
jgi:hypothetical protein